MTGITKCDRVTGITEYDNYYQARRNTLTSTLGRIAWTFSADPMVVIHDQLLTSLMVRWSTIVPCSVVRRHLGLEINP